MLNQIVLTLFFLLAILFLLIATELIYRRLGLKGEITRKFAHLTATLSTVTFPYLFTDHWYVLILGIIFFIILFVSRHGTQLKSIHDIDRKSVGSYMLPVAIYIAFLISVKLENSFLFILPMLILAICDPIAGLLGLNFQTFNSKIHIFGFKLKKTWLGSGSFFVSAFIISSIAIYVNRMAFDLKTFWLAIGVAMVSTLTEMFSWRGLDNLLIPLSVVLMLILFL